MKRKLYFNKMISLMCAIACLFMIESVPAYAREDISNDTIITSDNITEVLTYLGMEENAFEENETLEGKNYTVGEVRDLIERERNNKVSIVEDYMEDSMLRAKGTKNLSAISYLDSYHVIVKVAATYNGKKWTSAGAPSASVSQEGIGTSSKIAKNNLKATCYSSKIVLSGSVTVDTYIGVGKVGVVKINSNKITFSRTWSASDNL